MRILHVVRQFYPSIGGMEQMVMELCLRQQKQGLDVSVLTRETLDSEAGNLTGGELPFTVHRLPSRGKNLIFWPDFSGFSLRNYDWIHIHGTDGFLPALLPAFSADQKWCLSTHGGWFHTPRFSRIKEFLFLSVLPRYLRTCRAVCAVSVSDFLRFSAISPKTILLPNGIDYSSFSLTDKVPDLNKLLHVGAHREVKRIPLLLERFRELREKFSSVELHLIGARGLGTLPSGVKDLGLVSRSDLILHCHEAGIVVSASRYEGFGLAVVEAMASGCIPLVSDIAAFKTLLKGDGGLSNCGYLIDYERPNALLTAYESLLASDCQRQSMLANRIASTFDWDTICQQYLDLYKSK